MKFYIIAFLLILVSCTNGSLHGLKRRRVPEYHTSNEFVKYLLPELPHWANFSTSANCRRTYSSRYLNFEKLMSSYNLSYAQNIQFQFMFNKEYFLLTKKHGLEFLYFEDEETLFYQVADKIQAGITAFRVPKFKQIHLIWIDPALSNEADKNKLLKLMKSSEMDKGHPVFVSLCLGLKEMESFISKIKLSGRDIRLLPMEVFSPFSYNGKKENIIGLDFSEFFGKDKNLVFYLKNGQKVNEFLGKYKIKNY